VDLDGRRVGDAGHGMMGGIRRSGGAVKYLLLICADRSGQPGEDDLGRDPDHVAWLAEVERRGGLLAGARLRPDRDATTVRRRGEDVLVSDGPFAETKEQVGGFAVLDCEHLDAAIDIAARHPFARAGAIEVRPLWPE
jgi:hypothetical protein